MIVDYLSLRELTKYYSLVCALNIKKCNFEEKYMNHSYTYQFYVFRVDPRFHIYTEYLRY